MFGDRVQTSCGSFVVAKSTVDFCRRVTGLTNDIEAVEHFAICLLEHFILPQEHFDELNKKANLFIES